MTALYASVVEIMSKEQRALIAMNLLRHIRETEAIQPSEVDGTELAARRALPFMRSIFEALLAAKGA